MFSSQMMFGIGQIKSFAVADLSVLTVWQYFVRDFGIDFDLKIGPCHAH
jgi:hypothetical protein